MQRYDEHGGSPFIYMEYDVHIPRAYPLQAIAEIGTRREPRC